MADENLKIREVRIRPSASAARVNCIAHRLLSEVSARIELEPGMDVSTSILASSIAAIMFAQSAFGDLSEEDACFAAETAIRVLTANGCLKGAPGNVARA